MRTKFVGVLMALGTLTNSSLAQTMEEKVSDFIKTQEPVPEMGLAISIVQSGKTIFSKGYGYRDRAHKLPVTEKTIFAIGSTTKAFAATSFLLLEDEGKIDLNDPVNQAKSIIELSDPTIAAKLSVADILSHRSGLPGNDLLWALATFQRDDLMKKLKLLPMKKASFRKVSQYNNILYMALADVFEETAGETWGSYLTERLLVPLQMDSTTLSSKKVLASSDYALPYFAQNEIARREVDWLGPAGALNSNLVDVTKWLKFHLAKGKTELGKQLLPTHTLEKLYTGHAEVPGAMQFAFQGLGWFGKTINYGLGWFLGEVKGHRAIFHSGNIDGYSGLVVFIPDLDIGTVVLSNQSVSPFPGKLAQAALGYALGSKIEDSFQIGPFPTPKEEPPAPFDFDPNALVGRFEHTVYGTLEMKLDKSGLELHYFGQRWPIRYKGNGVFTLSLSLFGGYLIPMEATLDRWKGESPTTISIPLAADPEVPTIAFSRVSS